MTKPSRCLVLGGTGYVGSAVVRTLAQAGAQVSFTWHQNKLAAEKLSATYGIQALQWAATDSPAILQAHGPITALVQCIGTAGDTRLYHHENDFEKFLATSLEDWQQMHQITSTSTFIACQSLAHLLESSANIVIVGSMDGVKLVPAPVHYAAEKSALSGMVRALAKAMGPRGVCINMIAPGILENGIGTHLSHKLREQYLEHCSLKRLGTAQEIANLAAWLALKNQYVTGQSIVLDGGL